jgi:hypothetical protein
MQVNVRRGVQGVRQPERVELPEEVPPGLHEGPAQLAAGEKALQHVLGELSREEIGIFCS